MSALLEVDGLGVTLPADDGRRPVLRDVGLEIGAGEALGLVGESGSGKSMTAKAIARLLPRGARTDGEIRYRGAPVDGLRGAALAAYRGEMAMVFQDPRAHVNPVRSVGDFMTEALRGPRGVRRPEARRRAVGALADVGVDDGARRLDQYPHELSGGLLQRVMIATMLLTEPALVLADEPTTALDVSTQSEVLAILDELRRERGLALLFITHDLELASAVCDRTAVMYAGRIVEVRDSGTLHADPLHPYTAALSAARPSIDGAPGRLTAIPGRPISAAEAADGCAFSPRCAHARPACGHEPPPLEALAGGQVRCLRARELRGGLVAQGAGRD